MKRNSARIVQRSKLWRWLCPYILFILLLFTFEVYYFSSFRFVSPPPHPVPSLPPPSSSVQNIVRFRDLNMCSPSHGIYHCLNGNYQCNPGECQRESSTTRFNLRKFERFHQDAPLRQLVLASLLSRFPVLPSHLNLLIFNIGFGHQFINWYCSLLALEQSHAVDLVRIKSETIVLAADVNASRLAQELGFVCTTPLEMRTLLRWTHRHIIPQASITFGRGSHSSLNLILKIATPFDLFSGFPALQSLAIQDVDFVWKHDAFARLKEVCHTLACDAVFIQEGRSFVGSSSFVSDRSWIRRGVQQQEQQQNDDHVFKNVSSGVEFNTGLFLLTRSMLPLLHTALEGMHLQEWKGRDQPYFNSLLYHTKFSMLKIVGLPIQEFLPGSRLHKMKTKVTGKPELVTVHFSDTGSFTKKISTAKRIGLWFVDELVCVAPKLLCQRIEECWRPLMGYKKEQLLFQDDSDPNWNQFAVENAL